MTEPSADPRDPGVAIIASIVQQYVRSPAWPEMQIQFAEVAAEVSGGLLKSPAAQDLLKSIQENYGPQLKEAAANLDLNAHGLSKTGGSANIELTAHGQAEGSTAFQGKASGTAPAVPSPAPVQGQLPRSMVTMLVAFGTLFPAIKEALSDPDQPAAAQAVAVAMALVMAAVLVDLLNRSNH